jgi:hypothetical protein
MGLQNAGKNWIEGLDMDVGKLAELWRYPVKSMAGESMQSARFDAYGMIGDRCWAAINTATGDVGWGKSYPRLMNLKARYTQEPADARGYGEDIPPVAIHFPDGQVALSDANADTALSDYVGTPLRLSPLEPPENRQHYRWQKPLDYDAILKVLGIGPDEPAPDLSAYNAQLIELLAEHFSPPGTYYDMFPVHALTTSSIEHMEKKSGETFELARFRPSFLIQTAPGIKGLVEFEWIGKTLEVGDAVFRIEAKTIRCSMPARGQAPYGLPQNAQIAKSLVAETQRFLGAYLSVVQPGQVSVGDTVTLAD